MRVRSSGVHAWASTRSRATAAGTLKLAMPLPAMSVICRAIGSGKLSNAGAAADSAGLLSR
jgi:hypothetical protein